MQATIQQRILNLYLLFNCKELGKQQLHPNESINHSHTSGWSLSALKATSSWWNQQPCLKPKDALSTEPKPKAPNENQQNRILSRTELDWYSFLRTSVTIDYSTTLKSVNYARILTNRIGDRELQWGSQCLTPCYLHSWWMCAKNCLANLIMIYTQYTLQCSCRLIAKEARRWWTRFCKGTENRALLNKSRSWLFCVGNQLCQWLQWGPCRPPPT